MKKTFVLLLVLALISALFAGCSGETGSAASAKPEAASAPGTSTEGLESDEPLERNAVSLPLTAEPVSFTMWTRNHITFDGFSDYYDNEVYKKMEELTGVKLGFIHPMLNSENENFQLLLLSEDMPDFLHNMNNYYIGGMDKAIEDGVVHRLNEYAEQYMPNYDYHLNVNEDVRLQSLTDKGNLWGVHNISDRPQGAWLGLGIRQDWLVDAGLQIPGTMSELTNVLTVFRDHFTKDQNGPLHLGRAGLSYGHTLIGSYNLSSTGYIHVDGTVKYSFSEPGFKDYLMQLNEWYSAGLIDKDSVAASELQPTSDAVVKDRVGVFDHVYTFTSIWKLASTDPDFRIVPMATPALDGKTYKDIHVRMQNPWIRPGNSMAISTTCKNMEIACKYWDYFFTDDGILLANYGTEGFSFEYNAEGKPQYTEAALSLGNISYTQVKYALHNQPVYTIWSREVSVLNEDQQSAEGVWGQVGSEYVIPEGITPTQEEGSEHSAIKSILDIFVAENISHFITGTKSFDMYDAFQEELKSLGVDRAVALQQAALDRYYARGTE